MTKSAKALQLFGHELGTKGHGHGDQEAEGTQEHPGQLRLAPGPPLRTGAGRFTGPDGVRHTAPRTFETKDDARGWLAEQKVAIDRQVWTPKVVEPEKRVVPTFAEYAPGWLAGRELKPRTRDEYRKLIGLPKEGPASTRQDKRTTTTLLDTFGKLPLDGITPEAVRAWHKKLDPAKPTHRAHLYALLRTIMFSAVEDGHLDANPCSIRAAGRSKRVRKIEPATVQQVDAIAAGVPAQWSLLVQLAAWCALRFGECTALERRDMDLEAGVVKVRRGVTWIDGEPVVGLPKSEAGVRDVAIPPHLVEPIRAHLDEHTGPGSTDRLFTGVGGGYLAHGTFHKHFRKAREAAGRPDLRLHDCRHTGAVFYAQVGATTKELMSRLGHTTPTMAMNYQHVAQGRDAELAAKLSKLAGL